MLMTLLEDIQTSAIDSKSDLAALLRKCKLLAARLGSQPLEAWVLWESNGYPDGVSVPDYRVWSLEVKGYFVGPFGASLQGAPIPHAYLPEKSRKHFKRYEHRQSIAGIESLLTKGNGGIIHLSAGDLALAIGRTVYPQYNCLQAWAEFGENHFVELLNAVRNRILDLAVAVWKESPQAGESGHETTAKIEAKRVTQIFNTTVYGGPANLVGTANASVIEFNINAKDFSSLEAVLRGHGVPEPDLTDLRGALQSEESKPEQGFGPKVSSWIGKMVGKAADGTWNIGLEAAGNLLAQVISKYYGL
jgi:AbiTii